MVEIKNTNTFEEIIENFEERQDLSYWDYWIARLKKYEKYNPISKAKSFNKQNLVKFIGVGRGVEFYKILPLPGNKLEHVVTWPLKQCSEKCDHYRLVVKGKTKVPCSHVLAVALYKEKEKSWVTTQ